MSEEIYLYMSDPSLLTRDSLPHLEQIVTEYPYFATARMLYLKNLAALNDARFKTELERTSIYVPDRKMLFMLIEEVRIIVAHRPAPEKEDTFGIIDEFLQSQTNGRLGDVNADPAILFPASASIDYIFWLEKGNRVQIDDSAPKLNGHERVDGFIRIAEERAQSGRTIIDPEAPSTGEAPQRMGDYTADDDSFFTETLARVYIKQHRYEKALEVLSRLSLKYPRKNLYFADQIRFLEKLIINAKNKN